ncbi:MAG: hypothetical protein JXN60_01585 [Lentisphaerae bacterium]|nr:hypothetical protein [Lentisphaerota bacterium]
MTTEKLNMHRIVLCGLIVCFALGNTGCAHFSGIFAKKTPKNEPPVPSIEQAEAMFANRDYTGAMIECIDLARIDPLTPGLAELQSKIVSEMADLRQRDAKTREIPSSRRIGADIDTQKVIPLTYGLQRNIRGETSALRNVPTAMQKMLEKRVTVHLDNVNLDDFVLAIGASENINIIADSLGSTSTMTVHAEDVPISEVLDYVSRNLGVAFYVGENIIWATQQDQSVPQTPMETRMYRLRKGMSGDELTGDIQNINIMAAITKFVPGGTGSERLFDKKAHVLIVKDTRDNLAKIEDIIEALDVCPPQVLIEARFISTTINDLRELGIDWILESNVAVTKSLGQAHSQIIAGATMPVTQFFPDSGQTLNFAYQGLLTDPMFRATLHALESSGKSRTLSVPRVTTINNKPAKIRIGKNFPYFQQYDVESIPTSVSDSGSAIYSSVLVPVGTPEMEELGIELNVTPSVGADLSSVTLQLVPKITEFVEWTYYGKASDETSTTVTNAGVAVIKLPIFRKSEIETEVVVQSGETVVMGGLITTAEIYQERRVPILSAIPLLGRLFRHDGTEETKQNLLIFVTATILSQRGESLVPMVEENNRTPQAVISN